MSDLPRQKEENGTPIDIGDRVVFCHKGEWIFMGLGQLADKVNRLSDDAERLRAALTLWRDYDALDPDAPDDVARYQEAIDATQAALNGIE